MLFVSSQVKQRGSLSTITPSPNLAIYETYLSSAVSQYRCLVKQKFKSFDRAHQLGGVIFPVIAKANKDSMLCRNPA